MGDDVLRAALERIVADRRREEETWYPGQTFPTQSARDWHDGYVTAMAHVSLIASKALDPEGFAEHEEQMQIATCGSDRDWFEATGCCGHCGNPGEDCICTDDDPCSCGPHELRTEPVPCWRCKGTGSIAPVKNETGAGADTPTPADQPL